MVDINTFPGVGALKASHDPTLEKMKIEPGLADSSSHSEKGTHADDVEGAFVRDSKMERTVAWKRDVLLIPILGLLYLTLFLDRTNIANTRIEGIEAGLSMPANGYNTALWIFYIPFILAEIPSNWLLNLGWIKPRFFLGTMVFLLGVISTCQGLTRSYAGLLVVRFLMGIFEACLPAAAAYMLSIYYTKKEAGPRFAWFFNFALSGPLFSGLLAYAIRNLNGVGGLEGWRWIFIIEGLMTLFFALLTVIFLPNFPHEAKFLKPDEREYLVAKLQASRGNEGKSSSADDVPFWKIMIDWRIHLLSMIFFCCDITAASISAFVPTILRDLGYETAMAQIMTMPVWATGIVSTFVVTHLANKFDCRTPFMLFVTSLQLIGWAIMKAYVPNVNVRYMALFFLSAGTFPQMAICMGWLSNNLRGRKYLAVGMGWMICFGNCANFVSSNVFITTERPFFPTGFTNGLVWTIIGFVFIVVSFVMFSWKNKQRESRRAGMSDLEREHDDEVSFKYKI